MFHRPGESPVGVRVEGEDTVPRSEVPVVDDTTISSDYVESEQPDLPPSEGGVHSHGDGLMHIHPHTADEIYENANIKLFFHNSGVTLTDTSISSEEWGTFENGDICANSTTPGILKLIVNDVDTKPIATYVPSDRDVVEIIFE